MFPWLAKGNGSDDDTAAIQAALNTGRDIIVPDGHTFNVSAPLLFKAHGQVVHLHGTVKATAAMTAVFKSTDFDRVGIIGNGTVDGNSLTINCVEFVATARNPVGVFCDGITVTRSANDPNLFYGGILVVSSAGKVSTFRHKDVSIRHVTARNCGTHGILVAYSDGVTVENCLFDACTNHGHESVNCSDVRIVNNTAQDCLISGVGVGDNTINWVISGNVVRNCGGDGSITCEHNSIVGVISNNTIYDANTQGINVSFGTPNAAPFEKLRDIVVSNNVMFMKPTVLEKRIGINVYSSTTPGIGEGIHVTGNVIHGFNIGITYAYASYSSISGNTFTSLSGSESAAIKATLVTKVDIENNHCNTETGSHTIQILSYAGLHSDHVNVRGNHTYASAGATKSLVYIEGPNTFEVSANNTYGSKHYVECPGTATVYVSDNYGPLAGAPFSGGTMLSSIGSATATTVGAAGAAAALPAAPRGYVTVFVPAVGSVKIPSYNLCHVK